MLLSRLHSTAGVASILSSPALLTVLPFDANALRSYTALVPLRWLRLGCSKRWLRAQHELWIRCVLALFYRLGALGGCGGGMY